MNPETNAIEIAGRKVGPGHSCFIIAEAGVNHNGDLELAKQLVDIAADAGADAVKFQTFKADRMTSELAPKADYQLQTTGHGETQREMLRRLELSREAHLELKARCLERDVLFMSSPFDEESADLLEGMNVPCFKIPSGEITNLPFLEHVARKGKPMVVSTGMANLKEVETAVWAIEASGNRSVVLLHCVSNYPADPRDVNLRAMHTMAQAFNLPVGYSDHTRGIEVPLAAAALGACAIEKHFTLDSQLPGPDHQASMEPDELAAMVSGIRMVESSLGDGHKVPVATEADTASVARKSLVAARPIAADTVLTAEMIEIKRPGTGLAPAMRHELVGRSVLVDIPEDTLLTPEMLA